MSARTLFTITLAAAVLAATALPALAQPRPPAATLLPAGSEIAFTTRQMGVPVEGRFATFTAQLALDPKRPETGSVAFTIDTASARFGSAELDRELPKPTWLSATAFPQATFQSSVIKAAGAGRFEVTGRLTIKGQSREIVVPVQLTQTGGNGTASGSFTIRRLDFRIGEGEWTDTSLLADDVSVRFKLALAGLPAP